MSVRVSVKGIQVEDLRPDRRVDRPCEFVGTVQKVWEVDDGDATNLLIVVNEASDATQVGRIHVETLHHSPAATSEKDRHLRRRVLRVGCALDLVTAQQVESGEPVTIDFDAAVGREAVFAVNRRRYRDDDGKMLSTIQVGFLDIWSVNDADGPDRSAWPQAGADEAAE
jgi:hypothetical protein